MSQHEVVKKGQLLLLQHISLRMSLQRRDNLLLHKRRKLTAATGAVDAPPVAPGTGEGVANARPLDPLHPLSGESVRIAVTAVAIDSNFFSLA
jgi:hypothetical protein